MNTERLRILFRSYLERSATVAEESELMQMLANPAYESAAKELIEGSWSNWQERELLMKEQSDDLYASIQQVIAAPAIRSPKTVPMRRWRSIAAAAAVILVATGIYMWLIRTPSASIAKANNKAGQTKNDVPPGGNKAVLTLANGSIITLDSAHNGTLVQQGNATVVKQNNGLLAYNTLTEKPIEVLYNTLTTPRGGQYQLVLPDGSKVWLNAASSIRYPTAFAGKERKIDITGEAYFEVAKNIGMPFIVKANGMDVKVLGTHFNVNAYDDEATIRTTLLEGAVQVTKDAATAILKPGQESRLTKLGTIKVINDADLDEAVAWKNGMFSFKSADIKTVMRQIARWYDVEVVYEKDVQEQFHTEINRNTNASNLFKILETTGGVHFKIEGKKVTVMP